MIELVQSSTIGEAPFKHLPDGTGDNDVDAFHHQFNPTTQSVVDEVVRSVATIKNVDETRLDSLYDALDPEALEALLGSTAGAHRKVEVRFRYEGLEITVNANGDIWLNWD